MRQSSQSAEFIGSPVVRCQIGKREREYRPEILLQGVKMPQNLPNRKVQQIPIDLEAKMPVVDIPRKTQVRAAAA
jgi:hypothetical protein